MALNLQLQIQNIIVEEAEILYLQKKHNMVTF